MKTIILFATKYGAAREIAQRMASKIDGAVTHDLKQNGTADITGFDCVIIGSSVYAGSIHKEVKTFISQNIDALQGKRLGLFLSGLETGEGKKAFDNNFPPEIVQSAKAASLLGGIFDPKKAGMAERIIMKAITKKSEYIDTIDDSKIEQFAEAMIA